jgi:hypothetical protein
MKSRGGPNKPECNNVALHGKLGTVSICQSFVAAVGTALTAVVAKAVRPVVVIGLIAVVGTTICVAA